MRLRDRIHRLRVIVNSHMDQSKHRYFELRDNLERVMTHLGMHFEEADQSDSPIYETVSSSVESDFE